jgi:hypothetical protein
VTFGRPSDISIRAGSAPARPTSSLRSRNGGVHCDQGTVGGWSDGCGDLLPFCPECAERGVTRTLRAPSLALFHVFAMQGRQLLVH